MKSLLTPKMKKISILSVLQEAYNAQLHEEDAIRLVRSRLSVKGISNKQLREYYREIRLRHHEKTYLGDGLYVTHEFGQIILTTESGLGTTNRVVLEPEVLSAFLEWVKKETVKHAHG